MLPTRQRGLSIIEAMVGMAIGLVIVGGALKLFIDNLDSNRRLLLETRVNQDLRAASDLIARDLRRAGYWEQAASGVGQAGGASAVANPHAAIDSGSTVTYTYDKNAAESYTAGFRRNEGRIDLRTASGWQQLTDPATMTVTRLDVTPIASTVSLLSRCAVPSCPAGSATCPPTLTVRQFRISIRGQAVADPRVIRQMEETVRVRNDLLAGSCPAS
jgi:prepilin peptidase dependent protein B